MKTNCGDPKNTENKVLSYCLRHKMFQTGDGVVLGVSGGADSICLLFVLLALQETLGIRLHVVHVNHGLRPDAAEDGAYVESLCKERNIPFRLVEIQLEELAKKMGATCEEAGRIARYQAFRESCAEWRCSKIAVAHNSNDRAETMLFHLFRGTGLKGMGGILPVRDCIVRPLLCLEREEIEAYLKCRGIKYCTDSTNDTDDYTRNRIRHHILPYARQYVAEAAIGNMCRAGDIFAEEEAYLEEQTYKALSECTAEDAGIGSADSGEKQYLIKAELFSQQHPVIQKRLLLFVLKELAPGHQDIGAVHIEEVRDLFAKTGNREVHLPYGIRAERSYENICIGRFGESRNVKGECEQFVRMLPRDMTEVDGTECSLPDGGIIRFRIMENPFSAGEKQRICEKNYTKFFDYDKINKLLCIRTRRTGDYLTIRGNDGISHKKLKEYMITEKIPKQERDRIPVLAEGDHILWLIGYRISEGYKVTENTTRVLQAEYVKKQDISKGENQNE